MMCNVVVVRWLLCRVYLVCSFAALLPRMFTGACTDLYWQHPPIMQCPYGKYVRRKRHACCVYDRYRRGSTHLSIGVTIIGNSSSINRATAATTTSIIISISITIISLSFLFFFLFSFLLLLIALLLVPLLLHHPQPPITYNSSPVCSALRSYGPASYSSLFHFKKEVHQQYHCTSPRPLTPPLSYTLTPIDLVYYSVHLSIRHSGGCVELSLHLVCE